MSKIAVIGDRDSVLMYRTAGVTVFPCANAEEAGEALRSIAREGYACAFLTENLAGELQPVLQELGHAPLPAVSLIPSGSGSLGLARARLKRIVEKAVGADILFQEGAGKHE
ncbi:MAG TPA: V-type ATP synthase subunit F [Firmicutes bacterium]|nr:V-type ATP synthase subunit F [Bacillota bacterium]